MCVFLRLITNLSDADATLNAECGEECCDHAYDKLEYSLERFFVFCVTHGIRSLKLLTWLFSPATFGAPPRCVRLLPAFFVSVAKIRHPQKSIIRFYTFPAIRGHFLLNSFILHTDCTEIFIHGAHGVHGERFS